MKQIEISDEVYNYLNSMAVGFDMNTPDKVLRKLLRLNSPGLKIAVPDMSVVLLHWKGVDFPEGLQLRFKGRPSETAIVKGGKIIYRGKKYVSPSSAAVDANNGTATNGWINWEYLDESGNWKLLDNLRSRK